MVERLVKACNVPDESAGLTSLLGERFEIFRSHERLLRDVKPHHGDRPAASKGLIGCMGIAEDIGLGRWRDVSEMAMMAEGPAHDDELPDEARDLRIFSQGQREIGHRTNRDDSDLLPMSPDRVDDEAVGRSGIGLFRNTLWQRDVTEAVMAMNENGRRTGGSDEWRARSLGHRDVDPETFSEIERVRVVVAIVPFPCVVVIPTSSISGA
jgi:hypothetical protein